MKPDQEVIYLADVAKIIGKEYPAVQSMYARGKLPKAFKLGGRIAWLKASFIEWLSLQAAGYEEHQAKKRQGRPRLGYEIASRTPRVLYTYPHLSPVHATHQCRMNGRHYEHTS